jgi:hypothetical protein
MPKRRLTEIAKEFDIPFEQMREKVFQHLEEDMISGRGKNTWIDENGQRVLDEVIPVPVIYRGRVVRACNNPLFVFAKIPELGKCVNVRVKHGMAKNLVNKYIYIQADNTYGETQYTYTRPNR